MRKTFFISKSKIYSCLLVAGTVLFFTSCIHNQKNPPKPLFDLSTPGGEVQVAYNDSIPKKVYYYKVDDNGKKSQEIIGEAHYYPNKQEYMGGAMKDGNREGKWYAYFPDGSVQTEAFYVDGKEHGVYNIYRENGKPYLKAHYDHGICDGTWIWYDENGKQTEKIKADKNTIACGYCKKCLALKIKN